MEKLPKIQAEIKANAKVKADITEIFKKACDTISPVIETLRNLVDSSKKGIGKIYDAFLFPFIESQKAKGLMIQAQGEKDSEDIRLGIKEFRKNILQNIETEKDLSVNTFTSVLSNEDTKRLCLAVIAAMEEIEQDPDPDSDNKYSDEPIDETFFNHWRKEAELIGDEELRKWWAHLLVAETKKPHSISPRTLSVARNLTKDEAHIFSRICKGVFGSRYVICKDDSPLFGTYGEMLRLSDAGLIIPQKSDFTKDNKNTIEKGKVTLLYSDNRLFVVSNEQIENIHVNVYKLTLAGEELFSILKENINKDIIIEQIQEIARQNNNIVFKMYNILSVCGDNYSYDNKNYEIIKTS